MCPPVGALSPTDPSPFTGSVPSCVPTDPLSQAAWHKAHRDLHPTILAHSLRVFLYAQILSTQAATPWHTPSRLPLLFVACLFHDMGTSGAHDGEQRFEVEGADAATEFLLGFHASSATSEDIPNAGATTDIVSAPDAHEVWTAIALHTSSGIAERIAVLARLVRAAVQTDFHRKASGGPGSAGVDPEVVRETEEAWPRDHIEKILGDTVAEQAVRKPGKGPLGSWPGDLMWFARQNPGWKFVNGGFGN